MQVEDPVDERGHQRIADVAVQHGHRPGMDVLAFADDEVAAALELGDKPRDLGEVVRQVGVCDHDVLPSRSRESREIRAPVTPARLGHDVRARAPGEIAAPVGRSVVDHDHLAVDPVLLEHGPGRSDALVRCCPLRPGTESRPRPGPERRPARPRPRFLPEIERGAHLTHDCGNLGHRGERVPADGEHASVCWRATSAVNAPREDLPGLRPSLSDPDRRSRALDARSRAPPRRTRPPHHVPHRTAVGRRATSLSGPESRSSVSRRTAATNRTADARSSLRSSSV